MSLSILQEEKHWIFYFLFLLKQRKIDVFVKNTFHVIDKGDILGILQLADVKLQSIV